MGEILMRYDEYKRHGDVICVLSHDGVCLFVGGGLWFCFFLC